MMRDVLFLHESGKKQSRTIMFEPQIGHSIQFADGFCVVLKVIWDIQGRCIIRLSKPSPYP